MDKLTELLFLKELSGVGPARINTFYLPQLKSGMSFETLMEFAEGNEKKVSRDDVIVARDKAIEIAKQIESLKDINIVTILDNNYPSKMKVLGKKSPIILYYKGDLALLEEENISIVGTREPSEWTVKIERRLTAKIIEISGRNIVSGLALGCDTVAHKECIESGGKTIAVLPCGINNIFPAENEKLADEIVAAGGLLISEYLPSTVATQYTFVERDTLIAALSDATFVVECGIKSGTMHTVNAADKLGRRIAAYYTALSGKGNFEGNLHMLEEKGASKVTDTDSLKIFLESLKAENNEGSVPVQLTIFDLMS